MAEAQKKICIFTGSSHGARPEYAAAVCDLARLLVERGYGLVYGGGNIGLMSVIADAVLERGGQVVGVIPEFLVDKELAHRGLSELRVVKSMHERKAVMAELSDGFMGLAGGIGTMEEFFEVLSWAQLTLHDKPCGLLNTLGYYDHVVAFLDHGVKEGFLKPKHRALLIVESEPAALVERFEAFIAARETRRFERRQT
jgi:uncharacterized protein (TIGR00730 family)